VTSKLQVTIPKTIAQRYGIKPGQDIDWLPAGEAIRVVTGGRLPDARDKSRRLELFDRATERQRSRQGDKQQRRSTTDRGWQREELYERGVAG
jgi:bifunctional DNA-binding transcriptional regulator/antitoxin component of YhaV-PrlF toxin-antitoxin module